MTYREANQHSTRSRVIHRATLACITLTLILAACGNELPRGQATISTDVTPTPISRSAPDAGADAQTPQEASAEAEAAEPEVVTTDQGTISTADTWVDATTNLVGLESECGTVHYLFSNPYRDEFYAGIAANGMFRLDDDGQWLSLGSDATSDQIENRATWISYDPDNPDRFWEAGTYGPGVFRTDDGGLTFSRQGDVNHVDYVSTDLTDPERSTMLAGGHEDRIVYLSLDGGVTWTDIAGNLPDNIGFTHYPVVIDASTFLVGTTGGENPGVFRSTDAGATWSTVYDGEIGGPPVVNGEEIYWLSEQGLIASADRGANFAVRPGRLPGRPSTLSQLDDGRLLTHSNSTVVISDDHGASWNPVGPPMPFDPNGVVMTSSGSAIYAWRWACPSGETVSVLESSIVRLDLLDATS